MQPTPKKFHYLKGPKLPPLGASANAGLAGGMPGMAKAPIQIRTYGDFKKLHFAPSAAFKLRLG